MAKTVSLYTPDGSAISLAPTSLNYTHFSELSDNNTSGESRITDVNAGIDTPFVVRQALTNVANVYTGTGIDPTAYASNRRGVSLLSQIQTVAKVTDSADADYEVLLPISAHLVLKLPVTDVLTTADVQSVVNTLIATLYTTGGETRLGSLIRGALKPSDLG